MFNEFEYLVANPDVKSAVDSGYFIDGLSHYLLYGQSEKRLLFDHQKSRIAKAFFEVNTKGVGLEIGPSINPIAPKRLGFNVQIVDHLPTDKIRDKYKNHGVDIKSIEDVDFVWNGEPLSVLIGDKN